MWPSGPMPPRKKPIPPSARICMCAQLLLSLRIRSKFPCHACVCMYVSVSMWCAHIKFERSSESYLVFIGNTVLIDGLDHALLHSLHLRYGKSASVFECDVMCACPSSCARTYVASAFICVQKSRQKTGARGQRDPRETQCPDSPLLRAPLA
jgi:hypothetical protein